MQVHEFGQIKDMQHESFVKKNEIHKYRKNDILFLAMGHFQCLNIVHSHPEHMLRR